MRRPARSTQTVPLFPYATLFRSAGRLGERYGDLRAQYGTADVGAAEGLTGRGVMTGNQAELRRGQLADQGRDWCAGQVGERAQQIEHVVDRKSTRLNSSH